MHRVIRTCAVLALVINSSALASTGAMAASGSGTTPRAPTTPGETCSANAQLTGRSPRAAALQEQIESIVRGAPSGRWGVYVHHLSSGDTVSMDGDVVFHPASTIKIAIALDLLAWLETHPDVRLVNGPPEEERSFGNLLRAMLINSEEDATAVLRDFLNRQPGHRIDAQLSAWEIECSSVVPRRATPAELAFLLERLYRGELLSRASTDLLLGILRTPSPDDAERLGGGLPPSARAGLAHKTGTLFQAGLGVVADVGLVVTSRGAYTIAVLSNGVEWADQDTALRLISDLSRAVYAVYGPPASAQWR